MKMQCPGEDFECADCAASEPHEYQKGCCDKDCEYCGFRCEPVKNKTDQ